MKFFTTFLLAFIAINLSIAQSVEDYIARVCIDSLVKTVRVLSGEDYVLFNSNYVLLTNREYDYNDDAAEYIIHRLEKYGLTVTDQYYSNDGRNIIATQIGSTYPDSIYIVCAHYDAVTDYAADDNASGTAAVIEIARILSSQTLDYTLIYALFDEEEIGLYGSTHYAEQAKLNNLHIVGVINLEMFGYDSNDDRLLDIHSNTYSSSQRLANSTMSLIDDYDINLSPVVYSPGTSASDHFPFWNEGYGAIMIIQAYYGGDFTPAYHTINDRIDLFNIEYFEELSKLSVGITAKCVVPSQGNSVNSENLLTQNVIQVYPNPTSGILNIKCSVNTKAEIINQLGMVINQFTVMNQTHQIDLSGYPDGIYYIKIYDKMPTISKIIKQ